jgi:Sulfotransferase domain
MRELRLARSSGSRLPDFFIVGHAKCGTTAMHAMLRAHPQVYMSPVKETQFLAHDPSLRLKPRRPSRRPRTLEAYLSLFEAAGSEQRAGEASTSYLRTPSAPSRIAELCPDARIIAIFREPASFLRSLHLQLLQVNIETEPDFKRAIGLEGDRRRGEGVSGDALWRQALLYSEHVRYVDQLRRFHEHFGRDRVLALIYDDFRADNERVLRQVLRFLEVDDSIEIQPAEANPTVRVRSHKAADLVHAVTIGRGAIPSAARTALKVLPRSLRREALQAVRGRIIYREPPALDEAFMAELRRRFKGEVVAASEYMNRDLVDLWGYQDVG